MLPASCVFLERSQHTQSEAHEFHVSAHRYDTNSPKEELCLEYVDNFERQFRQLFPKRAPLLLWCVIMPCTRSAERSHSTFCHTNRSPVNECGIRKFVATTVTSTQLPYRELYNYESISTFLATHLLYEPLKDPCRPPALVPSPASTLAWQAGDSFSFSVVLTSFLLGNGYDAFCVSGYAPRWICARDQTKTMCPLLDQEDAARKEAAERLEAEKEQQSAMAKKAKYKVKASGVPESSYLVQLKLEEEQKAMEEAKEPEFVEDEDTEAVDELEGRRVHSWVLVRAGKRDVDSHFFIEPTTGRTYPISESPYVRCMLLRDALAVFRSAESHHAPYMRTVTTGSNPFGMDRTTM